MNLLLLLSALLSALSGLAGGGRAAERQPAVVCPVACAAARATARVAASRPQPVVVVGTRPALLALPAAWTLPVAILERTLRRRE